MKCSTLHWWAKQKIFSQSVIICEIYGIYIPPTDNTDVHGNFSLQKLNKIVENYSKFILIETKIRHFVPTKINKNLGLYLFLLI